MAEVTYCFESATELFKEMNEINKPLVIQKRGHILDRVYLEPNKILIFH